MTEAGSMIGVSAPRLGRRILDIGRRSVVIEAVEFSTDRGGAVDVSPLWRRSVWTIGLALVLKIVSATLIAATLGVDTQVRRMSILPVLAYDANRAQFTMITSWSTLAMGGGLVAVFLVVLVRHLRQQQIAGSAVGVLAATNALLVDLVLQHAWGGYVDASIVRWNLLLLGGGWLLVAAWFALDRPWQLARADAPASLPLTQLPSSTTKGPAHHE